jgi:hypothetical protein
VILAAMLFWSRRETPPMPPDHAAELRGLGAVVVNKLHSNYPIEFPGTALESAELQQAFRAHFPRYAKRLAEWDTLARAWNEAQLAIDHAARELAKANDFQSGSGPLYAAAMAQVNGVNLAAADLHEEARPDRTTALLYGQNQIAILSDPSAEQIAARKRQYRDLRAGVGSWPEVQHARTIRLQLGTLAQELLPEAQRIGMSHNVTVASKCPICPR